MEDGIGISWRARRSAIFIFASLVSSMKVSLPPRIAPLLIIRTCCLSFIHCRYGTRRALVVVCILCQKKENTLPLSPFSARPRTSQSPRRFLRSFFPSFSTLVAFSKRRSPEFSSMATPSQDPVLFEFSPGKASIVATCLSSLSTMIAIVFLVMVSLDELLCKLYVC